MINTYLFNWVLIVALTVIAFPTYTQGAPYRFALFAPRQDTFWPQLEKVMQAACYDLSVQCEVYYSDDNQFEMLRQILQATEPGPNKVDAVIFHNYKQFGRRFIEAAEKNHTYAFLINTPLTEETYQQIGKPRENYQYWLGDMVPDDEEAGYIMAKALMRASDSTRDLATDGMIRMIAITGIVSDGATIRREKGLRRAVKERSDVILYQSVYGDWSIEQATEKFLYALQRYPDITTVWAGNDAKGLGVVKGIIERGLVPGKDIVTAGIDWSEQGFDAVRQGEFEVDIGGHFLEGAWSVILLFDYLKGIDFADETVQFRTKMYPVSRQNVDHIQSLFYNGKLETIDFTQFSKYLNSEIQYYHFDVESIFSE